MKVAHYIGNHSKLKKNGLTVRDAGKFAPLHQPGQRPAQAHGQRVFAMVSDVVSYFQATPTTDAERNVKGLA